MNTSSLVGVCLVVALAFFLFAFILSLISTTNPYSGAETTVLNQILEWIIP